LCLVAGAHGHRCQCLDHEFAAAPAGTDAQKKSLIAREQDPAARTHWQQTLAAIAPRRLVFLDESRTPTTLTPLRGWAPRGQRIRGRVPRGRWHGISLLASLEPGGLGPGLQVPGAIDRPAFETFVTEQLVPRLQPGQIVSLDNLSVHKSARARQAIEAAGCQLWFLPTYSPDFNPLEQAFSKLKQRLRRAEARTLERVLAETERAWSSITPDDVRGFYRASGYNLWEPL
jgi:transposase